MADEPFLISSLRRNPTGDIRHNPEPGGALGTSAQGFLAEFDEYVADLLADREKAVQQARGEALREAARDLPGFEGIRTHGDAADWLRARAEATQ